jgi:hypothetical protein
MVKAFQLSCDDPNDNSNLLLFQEQDHMAGAFSAQKIEIVKLEYKVLGDYSVRMLFIFQSSSVK